MKGGEEGWGEGEIRRRRDEGTWLRAQSAGEEGTERRRDGGTKGRRDKA